MMWMNSALSSVLGVSRSHRTPPASVIALRVPCRWTAASDGVAAGRTAGSGPLKRSPIEMPSSVATAHNVATDGDARPSSICEIRLGETSVRAARPRTLNPAASRSCRIRAPRVSGTLSPALPGTAAAGFGLVGLALAMIRLYSAPARALPAARFAPARADVKFRRTFQDEVRAMGLEGLDWWQARS